MNVDTIFSSLRVVHIALGGVALLVAPGAMLVLKGSKRHRQFGKIYFWSMVGVATTAIASGATALAFRDFRRYRSPPTDPHAWWFAHMRGMLTAYIATVTAFSAVNFSDLPIIVRWLWPTIAGAVGIFIWVRYYKKRFALKP